MYINFVNGDLNKFVLLLRKSVYPYEYIDSWEKFDKTALPPKEVFYSNLSSEDILVMRIIRMLKRIGMYLK